MVDPGEADLRRLVLQTLESWNAAGLSHLGAVAVSRDEAPATPSPVVTAVPATGLPVTSPVPPAVVAKMPTAPAPAPETSVPQDISESETESNLVMAKKSASKSRQRFEIEEVASVPAGVRPGDRTLPAGERIIELKVLAEKVSRCTRCTELAETRTQTVFGVGNPQARLVFIGEAPGADEDATGEPFVGRAGQLLNKIIEAMKLTREEIYICNILRCRPPGNRLPSPVEAGNCREYLDGTLGIVNPEYIVCWGSCAAQNLLGSVETIGKLRRRFFDYGKAKVLCTYHPSYLLRNPAAKKDVWEDMQLLMKEMGL